MFKIKHILLSSVALCLFVATACEGEKELKVLSGKLPSKVKALYLVGNTTPNNPTWDIDKLDLLVQSEEDPYLWTYQAFSIRGHLNFASEPVHGHNLSFTP